MSIDSYMFREVMVRVNMVWALPLKILIAFVMLWWNLGPSAIAGVVVMVTVSIINVCISRRQKLLQVCEGDSSFNLL